MALSEEQRDKIKKLILSSPGMSVRDIAARENVSHTTVSILKNQLNLDKEYDDGTIKDLLDKFNSANTTERETLLFDFCQQKVFRSLATGKQIDKSEVYLLRSLMDKDAKNNKLTLSKEQIKMEKSIFEFYKKLCTLKEELSEDG